MKVTTFLVAVVSLISISCSEVQKEVSSVTEIPVTPETPVTPEVISEFVPDNNTPYATIEELELLSTDSNNVHYKVARALALQEALSEEFGKSFKLSYTPVLIHGLDGKAQYYEYRLTKDGNAYKSYAVSVLKHRGIGVATKLDVASNYSAKDKEMKVISPIYPSRYGLIDTSNSGSVVKTLSSNNIINQQFYIPGMEQELGLSELLAGTEIGDKLTNVSTRGAVDDKLIDLLVADMDDPAFWNALEGSKSIYSQGAGGDSFVQEARQNYDEGKQQNIDMFKKMETEMQYVINLSQEELEKQLIEAKEAEDKSNSVNTRWHSQASVHASLVYDPVTAQSNYWERIRDLVGERNLWCGPGAITMIMYAHKYKSDNGNSTTNRSRFVNILTNANHYNKSGGDGWNPMVHWELDNFFESYGYDLQYGNGSIWFNPTAKKAYKHIGNGNPIIFHTWGHWIFAFEANTQTRTRGWWIFKWSESYRNFRMTDNGHDARRHTNFTWWMGESNLDLIWMHLVVLR